MAFGTSQLTELSSAEVRMPATPYLDDLEVDPETKRVLADALEKTRASLGLADNFADGIISDSSNLPWLASAISTSCVKAR
jgi:hypothetical protein